MISFTHLTMQLESLIDLLRRVLLSAASWKTLKHTFIIELKEEGYLHPGWKNKVNHIPAVEVSKTIKSETDVEPQEK